MTWVLIIAGAWLAVSVVAALLIAGTIRMADQRHRRAATSAHGNFAVDLHVADGPKDDAEGSPGHASGRPAETRRNVPAARKPVVRDCIPPSERSTPARETGTR